MFLSNHFFILPFGNDIPLSYLVMITFLIVVSVACCALFIEDYYGLKQKQKKLKKEVEELERLLDIEIQKLDQ